MTFPPMTVGPIDTVIGPTLGGTKFEPAGADPHGAGSWVVAALAPVTLEPIASRLVAAATAVETRLRLKLAVFLKIMVFPFLAVQRQTAATSPADTTEVPTCAPVMAGPTTVAAWPKLAPINVRPLPWQTWDWVPAVAPCPSTLWWEHASGPDPRPSNAGSTAALAAPAPATEPPMASTPVTPSTTASRFGFNITCRSSFQDGRLLLTYSVAPGLGNLAGGSVFT
jgi:hypothetical protein